MCVVFTLGYIVSLGVNLFLKKSGQVVSLQTNYNLKCVCATLLERPSWLTLLFLVNINCKKEKKSNSSFFFISITNMSF